MELAIALIAGLAVFTLIAGLLAGPEVDPVQARLTSFASGPVESLEQLELQRPMLDRTLRPLMGRLAGVGTRLASPRTISRSTKRLAMAGEPGGMRAVEFQALKLLLAAAAGVVSFLLIGIVGRNPFMGGVFGVVLAALFFLLPEFWLTRQISQRQKRILLAAPDTLDLLTISVRAGLGFDGALAKVVEKMQGPLADEFRRALAEIRVGRTRRDALREVVERTEVPALQAFIGAIIQAEQLGVPIAKVLQVQSEQLRIERRQRAEEMAAKAPIKMLFPLVGCIFPSMFIVILGPAIILIVKTLGNL